MKGKQRNRISAAFLTLVLTFTLFGGASVASAQNESRAFEAITSERMPDQISKADKAAEDLEAEAQVEGLGVAGEVSGTNVITASTYVFTALSGVALEDMSTGTTQITGASVDDAASALANIGFEYWFDGARYTQFSVNPNGLMKLGSPAVDGSTNGRENNLATVNDNPKIAAYWDDQCTGASGKIHYKVVGSAPNRKLVVEFQGMRLYSGGCAAGTLIPNYQVWLYESNSAGTTPGAVQFVYGAVPANSTTNGGYTVGIASGATSFASVTTATNSVSYAASNNAQVDAIAAGTSYRFAPNVPNGTASNLTFTSTTTTSTTLNWTDGATNELGYAIYRSTDGVNFTYVGQVAANTVTTTITGLSPSTTYYYQVYSFTEGVLSATGATGSVTSGPPGEDACVAGGGLWSAPSTWVDGTVPTTNDNVTIANCTVTIDTNAAAYNVTVQNAGSLVFETTTARTLTLSQSLTIDAGGTVRTANSGTQTGHLLSVGANLTNNGTLDLSTNTNTASAVLQFTGATNNTWSGTGTNNIRTLRINKGSGNVSTTSPTLDINLSNFTVQGSASSASISFLDTATFNGIVKFSGTNTFASPVFAAAGYSIPSSGGVWLNNPNFTVNPLGGSPQLSGLLRVTQGTFNVGTVSGNSFEFAGALTPPIIIIEGGAVNVAGRFAVSTSGRIINYTQTGGTITTCTQGNSTATLACFDLGTSASSTVTISGGTIIIRRASTAASGPRDYRHQAGPTANVTGGTLQLGDASSPAAVQNFALAGLMPNLVITNTTGAHTATFQTPSGFNNVTLNVTINPTTTLNIGNFTYLFNGTSFTNNGTLTGNGASSNFVFFRTGVPITYTGSGTVTSPLTTMAFQSFGGSVTFDSSINAITVNTIRLFGGNVINSDKLTVGSGGASAATVQIGNTTTATDAGTFDKQLNFNAGTGGISILYLRTNASRTTGFEIPATRSITNLTFDDNAAGRTLTIAGGNLTVTGTLALTNGIILTGANTLVHNGTATRTNGYVDGTLSRNYTAAGAYTYHVGQNGYSPVTANVTGGTGLLAVKPVATAEPNVGNPARALNRYWSLTADPSLTGDLTFNYIDPQDIPATATEANFKLVKYNGAFTVTNGTVNTAANTATITGASNLTGNWTLVEDAAIAGSIQFDQPLGNYQVFEGVGATTIGLTRTGGTTGSVTVTFTVTGGTATQGVDCSAGNDFFITGGATTVTFADGQNTASIPVTFCHDTIDEPDETMNISLSNPTGGATLGSPSSAVITLVDDDPTPTLQFSSATYSVTEGNGNASLTVNLSGASSQTVTVNYTLTNGTATGGACGGADFVNTGGTVTFNPGETTKSISVQICDDTTYEGDETFNVTLSSPSSGATLGTPATAAVTITENDPRPLPITVFVDDSWVGTTPGTDPDGAGPATDFGYDAFATVQNGVNGVAPNGTVNVLAGLYIEDVAINSTIYLTGAGANAVTISGAIGGDVATVRVNASNVEVSGFTITRQGNNPTDWNNSGLNSAGVAIQGQAVTGTVIFNNIITGNRTGVDVNNSSGNTIRNNVIDSNRTGMLFRNQTDSTTVVENFITNNWTIGVLFIDGSGNTNTPPQQALNSFFNNNNISGNWYGQVADRQTGSNLPAPGTNPKNFTRNWFGTTNPVVTTNNVTEPPYSGQIPVAYGGTATAPGGQPDISGPGSPNIQYVPFLQSGTDTDIETTPGRGTFGFQGVTTIPGILSLSAATYSVAENVAGGFLTVTVNRTNGTDGAVSVPYTLSDGTATGGASCGGAVDYVNTGGTVSFAAGESTQTFTVQICNDSANEADETFDVILGTPTGGATTGSPSTATVTITNVDNTPPSVVISQAANQTDPSTATTVNFTVTFSEPVTGFDQSDVSVSGTAFGAGSTTNVVVTGNGTGDVYNVAVSGYNQNGTVVINIAAGAAQDAAGNGSTAATGDNSVYVFPGATTLYVDDDGQAGAGNCGSTAVGFTTVQSAVDAAMPGSTIQVCEGTYVENIVINKPLTLLGPNANLDPNAPPQPQAAPSRVAEATLTTAVSNPVDQNCNYVTNSNIITVNSTGVTVNGFTLDGDNPNLTSGYVYNGADIDAYSAIFSQNVENPNATIIYNIVRNTGEFGIVLGSNDTASARTNSTISNNRIVNVVGICFGTGVRIGENAYANIQNNVIDQVFNGVTSENFNNSPTSRPTSTIGTNRITAFGYAIYHNLHYGYSGNGFTISGNTINSYVQASGNFDRFRGIMLESIQGLVPVNINGNTITPDRAALVTAGYTRVDGIYITNTSTDSPNILINANYISNALRGISHVAPAVPLVTCNGLIGNEVGVYVGTDAQFGGTPSTATNGININNNNLVGNTVFGVQNDTGVLVNARFNYWGASNGPGPVGPGSGDKVTANVDYSDFMRSTVTCGPTAGGVSVQGRVLTSAGRGIPRATVTLTDAEGNSVTATTARDGNFVFENVEPGKTYFISIRVRQFRFRPSTQVITVNEDVTGIKFVAM